MLWCGKSRQVQVKNVRTKSAINTEIWSDRDGERNSRQMVQGCWPEFHFASQNETRLKAQENHLPANACLFCPERLDWLQFRRLQRRPEPTRDPHDS
jgi:hypothetical protein